MTLTSTPGTNHDAKTGLVRREPGESDVARITVLSGSATRFEGTMGRDGPRVADPEWHMAEPLVWS